MTPIEKAITALISATGSHVVGESSSDDVMRCASELISLITQSVAEARADGAREMREAAAKAAASVGLDQHTQWHGMPVCFALDVGSACTEAIRALPLPTKREPVRLTGDEVLAALPDCHGSTLGKSWLLAAARAIETAVLAANGLTK